jgi:hypothetical protein
VIETGTFRLRLRNEFAFRSVMNPGLKPYEHHVRTLRLIALTAPEKISS